jgi:hypothetical protein
MESMRRGIDMKLIKAQVLERSAKWVRERIVYGNDTSNFAAEWFSVRKEKCHWSPR